MGEKLGVPGGYSWATRVSQKPGEDKGKEEEQEKKEEDEVDKK